MAIDSLSLQLASALQRFSTLQRRAASEPEQTPLLARALEELQSALEHVRVVQEQLIEGRSRIEALQAELIRERERYSQLFDAMPDAHVVTDAESVITEVNRAAAQLFNVSQRFLVGKAVSVFVCENRTGFLADLQQLAAGQRAGGLTFKLRPRERAPLDVVATVGLDSSGLRWVIRPVAVPEPVQDYL
jgi:PAS domain-containing protein